MTAAEVQDPQSELTQVERWRADELERAGFDARAAAEIAARHDIDLHRATDLISNGCTPELALQILI